MSKAKPRRQQIRLPSRTRLEKLARQNEQAFREQIQTHASEIAILHAELLLYRDGLRQALFMLEAARKNEWTPADSVTTQELRNLLKRKTP